VTVSAPLTLPTDPGDWAGFVDSRASAQLDLARQGSDRLKDGTARSAAEALAIWNEAEVAVRNAYSVVGLLSQVHPDAAVRDLAEGREQDIARFVTERGLDRELYAALAELDPAGLDESAARLLRLSLRDFRRAGVDQADEVRERLKELSERSTVVSQTFGRNIREDVRSIKVTPDRLAGLPADFVDAHPVDEAGLVTLTTDYPDVIPFRTFASDAAARRELTLEFLNRGWPANDAVLAELLALRAERAALLGYDGWPDFDAEVKMVGSGAAIAEFIERIATVAELSARRDHEVLLARRRRDEPDATSLDSSCSAYYGELIRREQFDVDAQQLRGYFSFDKVRAGLLDVTGRLFGIEYRPVPDAPRWHPDVAVYDVIADGVMRGRIYLDLHPREGKYKHAAQFDLVGGIEGVQLPEGALVCNFSRGLMEHSDVVTLFHEFGHLVHHVLGGAQHWARYSGVATEWDFVEAPSQMLEEWAWDPDVLASFATDADGEPIPAALVARMRAAKDFGKGMQARTQMFYAAVSYNLHRSPPTDLTAAVRDLQRRYDLLDHIEGTHFHASFGHLDGYGSGYYTYMWSLVIAKDLFSAFDRDDLFDTAVAHRYRDEILAPGGSADASDLVANFLGRPYSFESFHHWLDTEPVAASVAGESAEAGS
jgi:thimet oligopeptidase